MTENHKELIEWLDQIERGVQRLYMFTLMATLLTLGMIAMLIMAVTQ